MTSWWLNGVKREVEENLKQEGEMKKDKELGKVSWRGMKEDRS